MTDQELDQLLKDFDEEQDERIEIATNIHKAVMSGAITRKQAQEARASLSASAQAAKTEAG